MGDAFLEDRQLRGHPAVRVQHERAAVEDLVVLPAHHVEIEERQARLDRAGDHLVEPGLELVAEIGRAVRHEDELGARFLERLDHVGIPGVLADRHAYAHAVHRDGTLHQIAREQAHLVEDVEVGQEELVSLPDDAAALEHVVGVVELAGRSHGRSADGERRAIRRRFDKPGDLGECCLDEDRLQDQVLRLVSGDEHLGQGDKVGTRGLALPPRVQRLGGVAVEVAHRRVELRQCHAEAVGHRGSFPRVTAGHSRCTRK